MLVYRTTSRHLEGHEGSVWAHAVLAVLAALVIMGAATSVLAQTLSPGEAPVQRRLLVLSPTIALADVGWDDNIFRVNKADHPIGDFTATLSSAMQASLQVNRVNVTGRGRLDFIYFRDTTQINSIDRDGSGRIELSLGRLLPFVGGAFANTRHRRNFEIDLPIRRVDSSWITGVDVRVSGKTTIGVMTQRLREDYRGDTIYRGADLAEYLGARATTNGVNVKYRLTPLTTLGAIYERDQSEFPESGERNSDGFRVMSEVVLQPLAAVSGSVQVGVRSRAFVDGNAPPFRGTVALADLTYTLLGRTRFTVSGQRDLSYSYRVDQRDYLQTAVEVSVTHRLGNVWDAGATFGRFRLNYGLGEPGEIGVPNAERGSTHSVNLGYRLEKARLGVQVAHQTRKSDFSQDRGYTGLRVVSSMSYGF